MLGGVLFLDVSGIPKQSTQDFPVFPLVDRSQDGTPLICARGELVNMVLGQMEVAERTAVGSPPQDRCCALNC